MPQAYRLEYMSFKNYITQYKLKYNIIKSLDSGAFGTVYEIEADDNKRYALKELKNFDMINKERFERDQDII